MSGDASKDLEIEEPSWRVDHVDDADELFGDHDVIAGGSEYLVLGPVQRPALCSLGDPDLPVRGWRPVGRPNRRNDLGE